MRPERMPTSSRNSQCNSSDFLQSSFLQAHQENKKIMRTWGIQKTKKTMGSITTDIEKLIAWPSQSGI